LHKFASKVKKSAEKYSYMQNIEEKSFVRMKPSETIKNDISEKKANDIFESFNREKEYMSRSRSSSPKKSKT
jgi:hypothetical protein